MLVKGEDVVVKLHGKDRLLGKEIQACFKALLFSYTFTNVVEFEHAWPTNLICLRSIYYQPNTTITLSMKSACKAFQFDKPNSRNLTIEVC